MKQALLLGLASSLAFSALAAAPEVTATPLRNVSAAKVQTGRALSPSTVKKLSSKASVETFSNSKGVSLRKLNTIDLQATINPARMKKAKAADSMPEGMQFWESFEGCDLNVVNWIPEGWSVVSNGDPELDLAAQWGVTTVDGFILSSVPDGNYAVGISFSQDALPQDEWLIMPKITPNANEQLSFQLMTGPLFFYDLGNLDFDTMEFVGDRKTNGNLYVMVKGEDGNWKQIWNMMDCFQDMSPTDLLYLDSFEPYTVPLNEFAGQEIEIAFRYEAVDCNSVFIDCVSVGLPSLTDISYTSPFETLYWGFDNSADWLALNSSIAQYPVLAPVTWYNNWENSEATYSWTYTDPETYGNATSDNEDLLTLSYFPDYSDEYTCRNNFVYPPVLNASAEGASPGSYSMPVTYLQMGGKPEFSSGGNLYEFGLLPFDLNNDGFGILTIDAEEIGDPALPVFGYSVNSDLYWLTYTLNGEKPSEGDEVKVTSILNFIYAPTAPLVVTGVHVNGFGTMNENAEFKIEIIPCTDEYEPMDEAIATAVCKYADILQLETDLPWNSLTIPFTFDTPAVIDDSHMAYIAKFSGFHSENVEYFVPLQSMIPNANYLCHGWLEKQIKIDSPVFRTSYTPMAYVEGQYGDCYNAFAINLEGYYPWLTCDTEEAIVTSDGAVTEVALGSYYDGSELELSQLTGLTAKVEGRYGDARLILSHDDTTAIVDGDLTISAPGVEKRIKVSEKTNGICPVAIGSDAAVTGIYTLDGAKVTSTDASGVYVVKYSDGTLIKIVNK